MEAAEKKRIQAIAESHFELRKLYKEHEEFERLLSTYEHKRYLTAPEEQEQRLLKRRKLHGVDRMMRILSEEASAAA